MSDKKKDYRRNWEEPPDYWNNKKSKHKKNRRAKLNDARDEEPATWFGWEEIEEV